MTAVDIGPAELLFAALQTLKSDLQTWKLACMCNVASPGDRSGELFWRLQNWVPRQYVDVGTYVPA